jgi:ketosteroid isomerase-like protein
MSCFSIRAKRHSARATGEAMHLAAHRLTIYRKQSDGSWFLARKAHTLSAVAKLTSLDARRAESAAAADERRRCH